MTMGTGSPEIERDSFRDCNNIRTITCYAPESPKMIADEDGQCAFTGDPDDMIQGKCLLVIPRRSLRKYGSVRGWRDFANIEFLDIETEDNTLGPKKSIKWKIDGDGVLAINSAGEMQDYGYQKAKLAPWCKNGKNTTIKAVVISDGVESIGDYAFYNCENVTSITIPDSVTSIGKHAFDGCSSLPSITIPSGVKSLKESLFKGCHSLNSLTTADDINAIEKEAFAECSSMTSITIPGSVKDIGEEAFTNCVGLTSVTLCRGLNSIGCRTFKGCSGLKSVSIPDGVTKIDYEAFVGCSGLRSVTIPKELECYSILNRFRDCAGLEHIEIAPGNERYDSRDGCNAIIETETNKLIIGGSKTIIPGSVTSIDDYALYGRTGLTSITIPASVSDIGAYALAGCPNLEHLRVEPGNPKYDSRDGCNAIIETETNTLIACCKNTKIPESVTKIHKYALSGSYLSHLTIHNGITDIEICKGPEYQIDTHSDLENISVNCGNPRYDSRGGCNAVIETETNSLILGCKNTIIPDTVTSIQKSAFLGCDMTSIVIPKGVTFIHNDAFYDCEETLKTIICLSEKPPKCGKGINHSYYSFQYGLRGFYGPNFLIVVPKKSIDRYKKAYVWRDFPNIISLEEYEEMKSQK